MCPTKLHEKRLRVKGLKGKPPFGSFIDKPTGDCKVTSESWLGIIVYKYE